MPGELAPLRPAAEEWLGLDRDASPEATRSALLRRLGAEDFFLDPMGHEAALVLAGRPAGSAPLLTERGTTEGRALRDRIESFAADFFQIPVATRRDAWHSLWQASAADPRLQIRLRDLEPGLLIDPSAIADRNPLVKRLAGDLLELFVLEPGAHAALAREKLWAFQQDPAVSLQERNRASRELTRRHPGLARLAPGYLALLVQTWRTPTLRRWRTRLVGTVGGEFVAGIKGFGPWLVAVLLFAFFNSLMARQPSSTNRPQPLPRPFVASPTDPVVTPPAPGEDLDQRTADLHDGFKQMLRGQLHMLSINLPSAEIDRITDELPWRNGEQMAGPMTLALTTGVWTKTAIDAVSGAIKRGLVRSPAGVKPEQIDLVVSMIVRLMVPKPQRVAP